MEKEIKLNLQKFSRIFTSSCKTQDLSEVIDHKNPIFTPEISYTEQNDDDQFPITRPKQQNQLQQQTPLSSFGSPYYPTSTMMMCKPRCPEPFDQMILQNCIIPTSGNSYSRRKIAGRYSLLSPAGDFSGRRCPPASPASPMKQSKKQSTRKKKKTERKVKDFNKFEKTHLRNNPFSFSSSNETDIGDWFSSDDEREDEELQETETLFSSSFKSLSFSSKSISLSSDSEPCNPTRTQTRPRRRRRTSSRRRKASSGSVPGSGLAVSSGRAGPEKNVGVVPLQGKVKDTFAVVKSSSDPYNDFRTSMVEMIIEKQIFGTKELEQLLQCFLSLNSPHHHRVIVEVFTEIWDALFSYCS